MRTWENFKTWELVLPPSRPSASHLDYIRNTIQGVDSTRPVAILGSTPEFRDLLSEMAFQDIYVFDSNPDFYNAMSSLCVYSDTDRLVEGDWLVTLPEFNEYFSVILSDLTIGNVPYQDRAEFYDAIAIALTEGGLFIDKVLTHPSDHLRLQELAKKYSILPLNLLHINFFSCEFLFCSELLDMNGIVDTSLFYDCLKDDLTHPKLQAFLRDCTKITPRDCIWYYGKSWHEVQNTYCSRLKTVQEIEDDVRSPYYGRLKLFCHTKP